MSHAPGARGDATTTTVNAASISIQAPTGRETVHPGDRVEIRWTSDAAVAHDVECTLDGGATFVHVARGLGENARMTVWVVPTDILSERRIRAEGRFRVRAHPFVEGGTPTEVVSAPFAIVPRKLPSDLPPPMTRQETPSRPGVALESIDPNHGPVTGGTTLTVYGKGFHPFTVARVGGRDATTNFKSVDTLQVITPPGKTPAFADVLVMNPDTRTSVLRNGYRYDPVPPPTITTVDPKNGGVVGGTKIAIVGANFTSRSIVTMGGARPVSTTFIDSARIEIVSPARNAPGLVDIAVTNADEQTVTSKNAFRYDPVPAPTIESVLPKHGPVAGGSTITILGKNFGPRTMVEIGGHVVRAVTYVDPSTLEAVTPPGASKQLVDVRVRNPDGQIAAMPRAFQYE
jgi:hypothetical protein